MMSKEPIGFVITFIGVVILLALIFGIDIQNKIHPEVKDAKYVAYINIGNDYKKIYCKEVKYAEDSKWKFVTTNSSGYLIQNAEMFQLYPLFNGYKLTTVDDETIYTLNATVFDINSKYLER